VPLVGAALMVLQYAAVTADVTVADGGLSVASLDNGVLGARWKLVDAVDQLGNFNIPSTSNTICAAVKPFLCKFPDIPSDPANDGKLLECDALSGGFGFQALPTTVGNPVDAGAIATSTGCTCP